MYIVYVHVQHRCVLCTVNVKNTIIYTCTCLLITSLLVVFIYLFICMYLFVFRVRRDGAQFNVTVDLPLIHLHIDETKVIMYTCTCTHTHRHCCYMNKGSLRDFWSPVFSLGLLKYPIFMQNLFLDLHVDVVMLIVIIYCMLSQLV